MNDFSLLYASPNFLNPIANSEQSNPESVVLPESASAEPGFQAQDPIGSTSGRFSALASKPRFFAWYFLGCGVLLLGYVLFPFWRSLAWEIGLAQDSIKERAADSALSNVFVKQYSDLDFVLGYVPDNQYAFRVQEGQAAESEPETVVVQNTSTRVEPKPAKKGNAVKVAAVVSSPKPSAPRVSSPTVKSIASKIIPAAQASSPEDQVKQIPREYRILIPSIKVNAPVFGGDEKALEKGVWQLPESALPGTGKTAMSGHRQSWFYHLDKVKVGDEIIVYRGGVEFRYKVERTKIVEPEDTSVLNKTDDSRLVLITCEPLVAMTYRIIIEAVQT